MISKTGLTCLFAVAAITGNSADPDPGIDTLLDKRYQLEQIQPAGIAGDLQFLRRVSLDLTGRIPSLAEIDSFRSHPDRRAVIDAMLNSDQFDRFVSEVWTAWLIGYSNAFQTDREVFRIWLQKQIAEDVSFKTIVQQMITATGSVAINGPANFLARHYEQPVVAVCRSFLGVRIECARCHDHPFDRWTQEDYSQMARFFQPFRRQQRSGAIVLYDLNPQVNDENRPKFLTGARPRTGRYRRELALYLTNCRPFARNFANRCWYQLLGRGIIDPPDDHNQENPAVDPELLDYLTRRAVESDFNIKSMFREICLSDAYQRVAESQDSKSLQFFAARQIKPLLPEQFVDSLSVALERPFEPEERRRLVRNLQGTIDLNEDFHRTWDYRETAQQLMQTMTFEFRDRNLGSTETVFMRMLTRRPTRDELETCSDQSPEDLVFALAFGNEFYFNQ